MSEEILTSIIQLLAIVAKEDGITTEEVATIESYLNDTLNEETASHYLNLFKNYCKELETSSQSEESVIASICEKINKDQTAQQKAIIILNLIILIAADGVFTQRENELLHLISGKINIKKNTVDLIKAFVVFQERSRIVSSNILIVDNGKRDIPDKCKHLVHQGLEGFLFILRVPEINIFLAKYIGEQGLIINGSPMKSNHIYSLPVGTVIKSSTSPAIYYSEIINAFRQIDEENHITFVARDVSYKFKNGNIGLRNINVEEEGGRLIALMGGSGAGKSTLLNVLNGNDKPFEGIVRVNGIDIHHNKKNIEGVIGYVPQDDLLIEELTVFDNLYYAAKLCFKDLSEKQLTDLVDKTLRSLGLYETKNLKVGSPLDKTISGGQRKRLNIGLELLREPSVLFVDEPTSGLSSSDSENIMDLLKELSLRGKMIFVVIHQPSEEIFKMFDRLLILDVGGYQIYYGNPIEGISYFKESVKMIDQSRDTNPELIFNIIESKVINEYGNVTSKRKTSPEQWYDLFRKKITIKPVTETEAIPPRTLKIPNVFKQLKIFSVRDMKTKLSNKQYLIINFLEAPALALLLAYLVRYTPIDLEKYTFSENPNIPVFLFMSVIVSLFMGLTVSAEEIIRDRKILKREAFLNLSKLSYLGSKLLILFSLSAIQTLTYVALGEWLLGIDGMFLPVWLILFSVSCFANILGLNVSSAFKSAITVYILIPLLVIPQLVLSGVVVNFDKLNPSLTSEDKVPLIGEIMASRWAFEALAVTQFKNNKYESIFYSMDRDMADAEFRSSYLFPRLKSDLQEAQRTENSELRTRKLTLVRNELEKELIKIGYDKFPNLDQLNTNDFDAKVHQQTSEFIERLGSYYNARYKKANEERQAILQSMTDTPEKLESFKELKAEYQNEALAALVKNIASSHRLVEDGDEYVQKIYPIFQNPDPSAGPLDFRTQFYFPEKQLFGKKFDTLHFNLIIIWMMSLILFIFLYFDVFRKIVTGNRN